MAAPRRMAHAPVTSQETAGPTARERAYRSERNRRQLTRALTDEGTSFEFVQVMRLLMRLYPERAAVGGWDDPAREVVRLSVPPSLAFPPSEIASLVLPDQATTDGATMGVRFFSLTGPQGVLPHVYTEHAAARTRARDTAFRDFLDLFHHRALSLFYRAWERHRTAIASERGAEDRMRAHLLDIAGMGTGGVQQNADVNIDTLAYYAGLLALRARPAVGLAQLIGDHFGVKATIEQFVGAWQPLTHGGQQCIGADDDDGCLGAAVIGDAIFDPMSRVRLRLGPLTRAQFDDFLPGGRAHAPLRHLARLYADDQVSIEVQLVIARDAIPSAALGTAGAPPLGFGSWIRNRPATRDADDVRLLLC